MPPVVWLFAATVFASAFLIFSVQPMVGKYILPWFGGVPAVWMTCLAFYQTALFIGYGYAYWLAGRISPARQPFVHGVVFVASLAVLPVLPGAAWKPEAGADATGLILGMLAANVALPFVLLASTGPLLQVWFSRALPGRSPYGLFAVSNLGSLLGLLSFPFLIEPLVPLSLQSRFWSWIFALTGLAILACSAWAATVSLVSNASDERSVPGSEPLRGDRIAMWVLFPASAVVMFMGVTNHLCLDLASVPFLWLAPLSVYLISFVLCFGSGRLYSRTLFMGLAVASLGALAATTAWEPGPTFGLVSKGSIGARILLYCAALFCGCMVAHGELYRLRPGATRLTIFYLCVAGGGALGGLFAGIAAPHVFHGYHELPIGVGLCWLLALVSLRMSPTGLLAGRLRTVTLLGLALVAVGAAGFYVVEAARSSPGTVAVHRNFFGILRVVHRRTKEPHLALRHGTTRHGLQYTRPAERREPTSYYGRVTGIGVVLASRIEGGAEPIRMGVVGLGVGTLAAYARRADSIVFYEINPDVVRIARDSGFFSFLRNTEAEIEIVVGDARLSLEAELQRSGSREFDVLVLDAFNSDSIPLHLLTREAFQVYSQHLREDGLLAVHLSNRSFDLSIPVARLGESVGLKGMRVANEVAPRSDRAEWLILSRDPGYFDVLSARVARLRGLPRPIPIAARKPDPNRVARAPLWTDDFSNVLVALREPLRKPR